MDRAWCLTAPKNEPAKSRPPGARRNHSVKPRRIIRATGTRRVTDGVLTEARQQSTAAMNFRHCSPSEVSIPTGAEANAGIDCVEVPADPVKSRAGASSRSHPLGQPKPAAGNGYRIPPSAAALFFARRHSPRGTVSGTVVDGSPSYYAAMEDGLARLAAPTPTAGAHLVEEMNRLAARETKEPPQRAEPDRSAIVSAPVSRDRVNFSVIVSGQPV